MTDYSSTEIVNAIGAASEYLSSHKEEINRLNVFPVPDGDTGTNMSLTLDSVVKNISSLPAGSSPAEIRHAITTGALMGARGNSGVITSQILRGLCEGFSDARELSTESLDVAFARAVEVSFQAVRKPVEGTILTVLKDTAAASKKAVKDKLSTAEALEAIVKEAYASVSRTPDLLPILKENNVVDAGGFGLAILLDGFVAAILKKGNFQASNIVMQSPSEPIVAIEQVNDWEDANFRYCNEFLVESDVLNPEETLDFLATMGDCELCVGATPKFKVHVHSNNPDQVLAYFLERGQVFEVFIHNMELQSAERTEKLQEVGASSAGAAPARPPKELGVVAVAPGSGNAKILESLGVDVVVSGGQTMNPSTADLLEAAKLTNASKVVILPNNSNIIMAANSACELAEFPCAVVPTRSVPEAFAAMFGFNGSASLEDNVSAMTEAFSEVKTGEVTTAIKDSQDAFGGPIKEGDVIGIAGSSINAVGSSVEEVVMALLDSMDAEDADNLTLLAGEDYSQEDFDSLVESIEDVYGDLEIDAHRGEQPLYPIVLALE